MLTLMTSGVFVLAALGILCIAAYKIKARLWRFEFSTSVWKLASFKITVVSDERPTPIDSQAGGRS